MIFLPSMWFPLSSSFPPSSHKHTPFFQPTSVTIHSRRSCLNSTLHRQSSLHFFYPGFHPQNQIWLPQNQIWLPSSNLTPSPLPPPPLPLNHIRLTLPVHPSTTRNRKSFGRIKKQKAWRRRRCPHHRKSQIQNPLSTSRKMKPRSGVLRD